MRFMIILLLLFQVTTNLFAQDLNQYEKKVYASASGQQLPYRILYPENYDRTKKYPLILVLHGGGERGNDNEKQLTHGAKLFLTEENRKNFPAIVIFPQCPTESYWGNVQIDRSTSPITLTFDYSKPETVALQSAIALVKEVIKEEGVDKKRIYITGLSMGGMGTFEAVYRNPKLFAAATPICGGGDVARYDKRVAKIPFRVFHGSVDAVVDVKESQKMVEKLKTLKASVYYTEYPNVNHNSWDNAFAESDFLSWMFSKKR
jgi:predicted peptidase